MNATVKTLLLFHQTNVRFDFMRVTTSEEFLGNVFMTLISVNGAYSVQFAVTVQVPATSFNTNSHKVHGLVNKLAIAT